MIWPGVSTSAELRLCNFSQRVKWRVLHKPLWVDFVISAFGEVRFAEIPAHVMVARHNDDSLTSQTQGLTGLVDEGQCLFVFPAFAALSNVTGEDHEVYRWNAVPDKPVDVADQMPGQGIGWVEPVVTSELRV